MRFVILVPVSLSIWHTPKPSRRKICKKLCDGMKATRLPAQSKLREPFGVARAACFERMAAVFAIRAASANTTATQNDENLMRWSPRPPGRRFWKRFTKNITFRPASIGQEVGGQRDIVLAPLRKCPPPSRPMNAPAAAENRLKIGRTDPSTPLRPAQDDKGRCHAERPTVMSSERKRVETSIRNFGQQSGQNNSGAPWNPH